MENRVFYHLTPKENVEGILEKGLLPGDEVGRNNEWLSMKGDPSYTYLFSQDSGPLKIIIPLVLIYAPYAILKERISGEKNGMFGVPGKFSVFKIELPESFALERDYDQVGVYIRHDKKRLESQLKAVSGLKEVPTGTAQDEISIREFIDKIPMRVWDKNIGSYRTASRIHPQYISRVSWLDLLLKR